MTDTTTLEQQARDLLERAGVEDAQSFTAGDLVEIANLLGRGSAQTAPAVPAVQIGMKASTWKTLSSDAQTLILEAGQRAVDKTKARRVTDAAARATMAQIPLDGSAAPAVPAPFDRTTALVLLQAASKSGDPGAISLAAQLAGAAPCTDCGYVNFKCRCAAPAVREPAIKKPIGDQAATDTSSATTAMTAGSPAINGALPLGSDAVREPHEPYLCIKPACGPDCSGCNCAISPQDMRDYAVRYAILRNAPINAIRDGGVFAGKTPDNVVINGEHLDAAVDALRGITGDSK